MNETAHLMKSPIQQLEEKGGKIYMENNKTKLDELIQNAIDAYWAEPAHQKTKEQYERCEGEYEKLANYAKKARTMSEEEFTKITKELWETAMEAGDVGYEFYKRTIYRLEEIRRIKI